MLKKETAEEEVTMACNEFQDLWKAKLPEDQLPEKIQIERPRMELSEEKMTKDGKPEERVTLGRNEF